MFLCWPKIANLINASNFIVPEQIYIKNDFNLNEYDYNSFL